MDIYNLGMVSWWESQCYYHALAYLGREGIVICRPDKPYVCLGLHDDLEQEIDQEYCRRANLPLLRRETGGGVVYLDSRQIFYQVVLHRENRLLPMKRDKFFLKVLQPAIDVCRFFGIEAEWAPPADIKAGGRKCSGNGAGDIGHGVAYVGNLMMDFDFDTMSRVLKVPAPLYQSFFSRAMRDNMLTLAGHVDESNISDVASGLRAGFEKVFGTLNDRSVDQDVKETARALRDRLTSEEWLNLQGRRSRLRKIKVTEGLFLQEGDRPNVLTLVRDGIVEEEYSVGASQNNPRREDGAGYPGSE